MGRSPWENPGNPQDFQQRHAHAMMPWGNPLGQRLDPVMLCLQHIIQLNPNGLPILFINVYKYHILYDIDT